MAFADEVVETVRGLNAATETTPPHVQLAATVEFLCYQIEGAIRLTEARAAFVSPTIARLKGEISRWEARMESST